MNSKEQQRFVKVADKSPEEMMGDKRMQRLRLMLPFENPIYTSGDIGNALLFADVFQSTVRYVRDRKCFFVYDGCVWRADTGNLMAMERCKLLASLLMIIADDYKTEGLRAPAMKRAMRWCCRSVRETILKDAAGIRPLSMADFDADPLLFNCKNGTLRFGETVEFYAHNPADLLTKCAGAAYDPEATCSRWNDFISEIMDRKRPQDDGFIPLDEDVEIPFSEQPLTIPTEREPSPNSLFHRPSEGDAPLDRETIRQSDKALYLQMALGYTLTGLTREECFFILYGASTRNGKGTAMETLLTLMGDYGKSARPETIGAKFLGGSNAAACPSEDIARLAGARFVNISEPDKKLTLSAALVKSLTGNDTMTARYLHENSFEFRPQFKMFINTNYLPQITDLTLFSSGRVKLIPFERHFEESEQDKGLKAFFARPENLSGILNWCILGYYFYESFGLETPPCILEATDSYHHESDKITQFVEECLVHERGARTRAREVYLTYKSWCEENGYQPESIRNFRAGMKQITYLKNARPTPTANPTHVYLNYRIRKE